MKKENLDLHIKAYDKSQIYSYDMEIWMAWYVKRLKELLNGNSCLELGIGHGYTTETFSKFFEQYTVLEESSKIIERYKIRNPQSTIVAKQEYFEDFQTTEKFDVILMGYVLEHVTDPEYILNKYKLLLKENGRIYVTVPNGSALNRRFGLKAGYIKSLDAMSEFDYTAGHKRTFTYESLIELVNNFNLRINKKEGIFLKCMSTAQMIQLNIPENIIQGMCEVAVDYPELAACILLELKN